MNGPVKRVVLAGAGHAHLHVLAHAHELVCAGAQVVLVDPGDFWYSGMATGMLGGMYSPEEDRISARRLAELHGGKYVPGRMASVDTARGLILLDSDDAVPYDLLSVNIGSEVGGFPPAFSDHGIPVKPIPRLLDLREHLAGQWSMRRSVRVCVLGGGPGGCEVAANLAALAKQCRGRLELHIVQQADRLAPQFPRGASASLRRALDARGIVVHPGTKATGIRPGLLLLDNGELPFDVLVLATGLRAPSVLAGSGLPCDDAGNLQVDDCLRVPGLPNIFGAGDCVSVAGKDLPKVGVFGVRQAPVLLHNLLAALRGGTPRAFHPQKQFLLVLNLGEGEGLAVRGRWYWRGAASLRLKHHLDQRFMNRYRALLGDGTRRLR